MEIYGRELRMGADIKRKGKVKKVIKGNTFVAECVLLFTTNLAVTNHSGQNFC